MDPLIGAALLGGASSIIGNIGAGRRQRKADERNVKFWKMQNAYNHPSQQMERLKAAGLNPNMMYGTSPTAAVGNADGVSPSKAAPFENPINDIAAYQNIAKQSAVTDNVRVQKELLMDKITLQNVEIGIRGMEAGLKGVELDSAKELYQTNVQFRQEMLRNLQQEITGKALDNKLKNQTLKPKITKVINEAKLAIESLEGQKLTNELRKLETELKRLGTENSGVIMRMLSRQINDGGAIDLGKIINAFKFKY